ncbi:hypothetical protein Poli38472_009268 [Pythium oligandrum]|uniref:Uncharacterized protein n=1 Tax=Pythium oligandrum TaxID=41045 RepID=A0A8K1FJN0_PYTOL|nr:hypothetical protein Poli38472_009268 [Pythium oligandrum]|eukprot:TMW65101.1 hypothetical protein Poli38472_009268 [Pythium oligandrum]
MFISFKIYNIFLCIILFGMMKTLNSTSFQIRQNPHKVGNYGGIPKIATFWRSELMCDLITILLMLTACGHVLGTLLMLTRFRKIADNGVMQLLQKRYFWVGWDALMAAKMLGLDPTRSTWMVDGKAVTRCPLGTLIQTLYQSGPSGFVHLAGDYIFTGSGFTAEPRKFRFPAKRAIAMGLCSGSNGSLYRKDDATEPESAFTLHRNTTHPTAMVAPVDPTGVTEPFLQKEKASIFDRDLKLVADGYMGKILLVDKAEPGAMTTNKDTGLREYVVCDALSTISILDIKGILGNEKKLRIE